MTFSPTNRYCLFDCGIFHNNIYFPHSHTFETSKLLFLFIKYATWRLELRAKNAIAVKHNSNWNEMGKLLAFSVQPAQRENRAGGWNVSQNQSWGCKIEIVQYKNNYISIFPSRSCSKTMYFKWTKPEKSKEGNREKIKWFNNGKLPHHEAMKKMFCLFKCWFGSDSIKTREGKPTAVNCLFFFIFKEVLYYHLLEEKSHCPGKM